MISRSSPLVSFFWTISILCSLTQPLFAQEFSEYPAQDKLTSCHALKFDSYHRVQNIKSNILSANPNVSVPNFGGRYLLLKAPLMMETLWYVADCETGLFFRNYLEAKEIEFKADSNLVKIKDGEPKFVGFTGKEWIAVQASNKAQPPLPPTQAAGTQSNPSASINAPPAPSLDLMKRYEQEFSAHPSKEVLSTCAPLDFNSFHRVQAVKGQIKKLNPNLESPNFAGHYLFLKNEVLFETLWFIADCKSGKFINEFFKGNVYFTSASGFFLNPDDTHARPMVLYQGQVIPLRDRFDSSQKNLDLSFTRDDAREWIQALPKQKGNPTRFSFESLQCLGDSCSITYLTPKPERLNFTLKSESQPARILHLVGGAKSGECDQEKPKCSIHY